eukprot:TRINITY_DN57893_c0_g1_i1.p1 TRINITY_DN57893_c0_g1~~TRINITY_DN57893_c0_g1_i1.p1  ORF type:complete len:467 (+),score=50.63 TRINITY_DN57893_c0_g1_i1:38-1402(+)
MDASLVLAGVIAFVFCAIAVGGGVGGGALYMPVFVLATGDVHLAVPLSKVTTNGVSWSAFIFNMWLLHPERSGPLIDYDVALLLEPLTLLGTILGVFLNVVSTPFIVIISLVAVLAPTGLTTIKKGFAQKHASLGSGIALTACGDCSDHGVAASRADGVACGNGGEGSVTGCRGNVVGTENSIAVEDKDHCQHQSPFVSFEIEDNDRFSCREAKCASSGNTVKCPCPLFHVALLVLVFGVHASALVVAGGPLNILFGNLSARAIGVGLLALHIIFTWFWRRRMLALASRGQAVEDSHVIDEFTTWFYPVCSCFAGVCAGGLGIAGGLIKGPMMIQWGLSPQASTATSIFMVLFTSSSTVVQYALLGRLTNVTASVFFWLVGFFGGLVGSKVIAKLMEHGGRQWQITVGLGYLILASMFSMCGVALMNWMSTVSEGSSGTIVHNVTAATNNLAHA